MNKFKHFVGIDIAKDTFDVYLMSNENQTKENYIQFENKKKGFTGFLSWLKKQKINLPETLICMEHTGIYNYAITKYLCSKCCNLWVEMALKIIKSMGVSRGKTDKIDAKKIARYAMKNQMDYLPYIQNNDTVFKIKQLLNVRSLLQSTRTKLNIQIAEMQRVNKDIATLLSSNIEKSINAITIDIKRIEKAIMELINSDEKLNHQFNLVLTIPGIGWVTFCYLAFYTNGFTKYSTGKQLACYAGVVPFEYSSGTSVRGKAHVHPMANKELKRLLHTAALSAKKNSPEFANYFDRKVAEGKNKMLVINNIRNKLILRIAAVIKNDQPYQVQIAA